MKANAMKKTKTPSELGYRMPAEWEKHDAIWLAWPHDPSTFPDRVEKVEGTYAQIIEAIHESENVNLFVKDETMKARAAKILDKKNIDLTKIAFHTHKYADVWFRDYGPIFLTRFKSRKPTTFIRGMNALDRGIDI